MIAILLDRKLCPIPYIEPRSQLANHPAHAAQTVKRSNAQTP
jgi:hypothetical protein